MKKRILFVDNEPHVLQVYGILAQKFGYEFATATDGVYALDLLSEGNFDGMITTFVMARLAKVEFIRRVRQTYPNIPIGMTAGMPLDNLSNPDQDFLDSNIKGVLRKPVGIEEFKEALFRWFGPPNAPSHPHAPSPLAQ